MRFVAVFGGGPSSTRTWSQWIKNAAITAHKALLLSDPDIRTHPIPVTKGHVSTYSGHRDRLDRAGLLRAIARAREAEVMTEDHARTLAALVEQFGGRRS